VPCQFQGKIYRWDASEEEECESFAKIVQRVCFLFCTPASLCKHLHDKAKHKVSLKDFSLIVLDECHHVAKKNPFNEIMNYYRMHKYGSASRCPQVIKIKS
jgi:superfamily II DNA or RNA helicase